MLEQIAINLHNIVSCKVYVQKIREGLKNAWIDRPYVSINPLQSFQIWEEFCDALRNRYQGSVTCNCKAFHVFVVSASSMMSTDYGRIMVTVDGFSTLTMVPLHVCK